MALSRHKLRPVFDRYKRQQSRNLAEAPERLLAHLADQQSAEAPRSASKVRDLLTYQDNARSVLVNS